MGCGLKLQPRTYVYSKSSKPANIIYLMISILIYLELRTCTVNPFYPALGSIGELQPKNVFSFNSFQRFSLSNNGSILIINRNRSMLAPKGSSFKLDRSGDTHIAVHVLHNSHWIAGSDIIETLYLLVGSIY